MSKQMNPPMKNGRMPMGKEKPKFNLGALKRVLKMLFKSYPVLLPLTLICIVFFSCCSYNACNF